VELPLAKEALQTGDELASKDAAEDLHRQKEGVLGMNPARVVWRQSTGGDDAVYVRMSLQVLPPGVEHAQEADLEFDALIWPTLIF
jgi:hypothetical protein